MSKRKRNIGLEIRDGLRELKRGDYGRVINIPDVAKIREKVLACRSRDLPPSLCLRSHPPGLGTRATRPVRRGPHPTVGCRSQPTPLLEVA